MIADCAYDSRALRELIATLGATAVIPPQPTRTHPQRYDPMPCRLRNRIERCDDPVNRGVIWGKDAASIKLY